VQAVSLKAKIQQPHCRGSNHAAINNSKTVLQRKQPRCYKKFKNRAALEAAMLLSFTHRLSRQCARVFAGIDGKGAVDKDRVHTF